VDLYMKNKKNNIYTKVDELKEDLLKLSRDIHSNPEIKWEEFLAVENISKLLNKYDIKTNVIKDLPTAFTATIKGNSEGPVIAFLAEYDALPDIGHACGHNLIAITNVGAFLGFLALNGDFPGEVRLIGTPAEEADGGKITLLEKKIFEDIDISLSSHGSSHETIFWENVPMGEGMSLAEFPIVYEFYGKSSHAAASPEKGLNALNAVLHLFSGIDSIRQHVTDDVRIHGIITEGGKAPNIVPDFCSADFLIRSKSTSYLENLRNKINNIAQGAALMTGTELKIITTDIGYKDVIPNTTIAGIGKNMIDEMDIIIDPQPPNKYGSGGGTDFGNISHVMPSYAFNFAVSQTPVTGHSPDMEKASISDLAHKNSICVAKAMASTALLLIEDESIYNKVQTEFENRMKLV
jgi:amidohydrolase